MHRATELLTKLGFFFSSRFWSSFFHQELSKKGTGFIFLFLFLTSDWLNCSQLELPMFLSGMLGCEGGDQAEVGEMHLWLEHAQMRPLFLQERWEGESWSQMCQLILVQGNCMQNQAIAGLQTCSKGRGSGAESQIRDPEKLHSFLCYWSYLGLEQSSHHGKCPAGCYQKPSYLVGQKLWPTLQTTVTQSRKKNPWVSWI